MKKIIGKINGAIGIISEIREERTGLVAVIDWQNAKKGQYNRTFADVEYLCQLEKRNCIEIINA